MNSLKNSPHSNGILFGICLLLVTLIISNPNLNSFQRYLGSKGFSSVDVWLNSQIGRLLYKNYVIFSIVKGKIYEAMPCHSFLGLFSFWVPLCPLKMLPKIKIPDCGGIGGCFYRGVCIKDNVCLCLPSFKGGINNCKVGISNFRSFETLASIPWEFLDSFGLLELISTLIISSYLISLFIGKSNSRISIRSLVSLKFSSIVLSPFCDCNIFQFIFNIYTFYQNSTNLYVLVGFDAFVGLFFLSWVFGCAIALSYQIIVQSEDGDFGGISSFLTSMNTLINLMSLEKDTPIQIIQNLINQSLLDFAFSGKINLLYNFGGVMAAITANKYFI